MRRHARALPLFVALAALAACHARRPVAHYPVGDGNRTLRQAFNADADKVRVVMLVAPD